MPKRKFKYTTYILKHLKARKQNQTPNNDHQSAKPIHSKKFITDRESKIICFFNKEHKS